MAPLLSTFGAASARSFGVGGLTLVPEITFDLSNITEATPNADTGSFAPQINIKTGNEISGATFAVRTMTVENSGAYLFVGGTEHSGSRGYIARYTLGTAKRVDTMPQEPDHIVNIIKVVNDDASSSGMSGSLQRFRFNSSGTKLVILADEGSTTDLFAFDLSTAWDLTTASFANEYIGLAGYDAGGNAVGIISNARGLDFNTNGTKMLILNQSSDVLTTYTLSTGFDVSTITETGNSTQLASLASYTSVQSAQWWRSGGQILIADNGQDGMFSHTVNSYAITNMSSSPTSSRRATDGDTAKSFGDVTIYDGDSRIAYGVVTGSYLYDKIVPSNGINDLNMSENGDTLNSKTITWGSSVNPRRLQLGDSGKKVFFIDQSDQRIYMYLISNAATNAYDISYMEGSAHSSLYLSGIRAFRLVPDGTEVLAATSTAVNTYSLSSAYDLSTAGSATSYSLPANHDQIEHIFFNGDGTEVFVFCRNTTASKQVILKYSLSTAYDYSTKSNETSIDFSFTDWNYSATTTDESNLGAPADMQFTSDGLTLVCADQTNGLYAFEMTKPYNLNTAAFLGNAYVPRYMNYYKLRGMWIKEDDSKIYVMTDDTSNRGMYTGGSADYRFYFYQYDLT